MSSLEIKSIQFGAFYTKITNPSKYRVLLAEQEETVASVSYSKRHDNPLLSMFNKNINNSIKCKNNVV